LVDDRRKEANKQVKWALGRGCRLSLPKVSAIMSWQTWLCRHTDLSPSLTKYLFSFDTYADPTTGFTRSSEKENQRHYHRIGIHIYVYMVMMVLL